MDLKPRHRPIQYAKDWLPVEVTIDGVRHSGEYTLSEGSGSAPMIIVRDRASRQRAAQLGAATEYHRARQLLGELHGTKP